jgi:hypothetical protein
VTHLPPTPARLSLDYQVVSLEEGRASLRQSEATLRQELDAKLSNLESVDSISDLEKAEEKDSTHPDSEDAKAETFEEDLEVVVCMKRKETYDFISHEKDSLFGSEEKDANCR